MALATAPFLRTRAYDDDRERILRDTLAALGSTETELEGSLLAALFAVQAQRGLHAELPALAARQLDLARRTGDRPREFTALMQSGWVAQTAHRVDEAVGCYEAAGRLALELDDQHGHVRALGATGVALRNAGRAGDADPLLARTVDDVRAAGQARDTCIWLVTRAEGLIDVGAVDEADELLLEASDIAEQLGDELGLAHCRMARAAVLVVRRDPGAADDLLARSRPVLDTQAPGGCEPEALRVAADIAVLRQDHAHACAVLSAARRSGVHGATPSSWPATLHGCPCSTTVPRRPRGPRGAADPRRPRSRPEGPAPTARTLRGPLNSFGETGRASPLAALGAGYLHLGCSRQGRSTQKGNSHMKSIVRVVAATITAAAISVAGTSAHAAPTAWCLGKPPAVNGTCQW